MAIRCGLRKTAAHEFGDGRGHGRGEQECLTLNGQLGDDSLEIG